MRHALHITASPCGGRIRSCGPIRTRPVASNGVSSSGFYPDADGETVGYFTMRRGLGRGEGLGRQDGGAIGVRRPPGAVPRRRTKTRTPSQPDRCGRAHAPSGHEVVEVYRRDRSGGRVPKLGPFAIDAKCADQVLRPPLWVHTSRHRLPLSGGGYSRPGRRPNGR